MAQRNEVRPRVCGADHEGNRYPADHAHSGCGATIHGTAAELKAHFTAHGAVTPVEEG